MGLLGVPCCSNLPKVFRCLCAKTCKCACATQVCDCEDPPNTTAELLPLNKSGTVFTWEAQISICSKDGNQLKILTCDFTDLFDANQLDATAAANAQTALETLRLQGILPITIFGGPPSSQTCTTAPPCPLGQVLCYSRFYESVCATRCDGFEECVDATDELGCRPCETVQCELPFGRCVDSLSGASACDECSNEAANLSHAQRQLCQLLDVPAGQGALGSLQCNASICEALGEGCDPSELDFEPCRCLEARATLAQREAFGCLVRGNFSAALRPVKGLMSLYHFDAVKAKKLYDELDVINLECTNSAGSSGGCAVSSVDRIEGPALLLTGEDWLQSLAEVPPPSLQAWHLWVKCTCTSCTLAGLLGGGTWFVDEGGYLATKSPSGNLWQPAGCAAVNDDVFHFVGFSLGPDGGEQIFQDGQDAKTKL
ncbi:unnamed protein product [Cladocopium goreaui]|uniref:Uncharacterized protein n=1 Tax=Cladocopium goreaui TaxID=2562237 RepID=A0A9P1C5N4_9DINO|nr:unnamed protein product [Cladocopium goreaui]